MTSYPAITLWQPWASLVAAGAKRYEFRSWPAPKRLWGQRVAVHAGARPTSRAEVQDLLLRLRRNGAPETALDHGIATMVLDRVLARPNILPLGSVLCLATLGQPMRGAEMAVRLGLSAPNDSDRGDHANWGWPLIDVERLEPYVPARGAQGWWTWTRPDA